MFSAATHAPDSTRTYPYHHDRHMSHSGEHPHYGLPQRPSVELPRPLEPRPSYQMPSSLSEASAHQRRPDAFRGPPPVQTEYRPQGQSLPRLQDILTSTSPISSQAPYTPNAWSGPPSNQQNGEGYYGRNQAAWHPPLAPPPSTNGHAFHSQQARRIELPILETSAKRHDSQVPSPPYASYQDHSMEYHDPRREPVRQPMTAANPYSVGGVPSPYTTGAPDDLRYRSPPGSLERPGDNNGPAGPESSKKYIGVREVPGEGAFHLYEGGFRIPTHVDGETVNPAWGLTKANKPRKRLAMACLDCREKKIKCEPGAASCLQCEKAKRVCRKASTHQSQSEAGGTPVWPSGAESPTHKSTAGSTPPHMVPEGVHKRRTMDATSPSAAPTKKHRSASPLAAHVGAVQSPGDVVRNGSPFASRVPARVITWEEDPYVVNPEATVHLLNYYFADVNDATYCIFPRHHFMNWLKTNPEKCQSERMVLYAMLAVGSIFADDSQYSGFAERCVAIAGEAIQAKIGRFSMCVVQARLLLGMYHFAKGANGVEWDYIGSGIQAALYLRYHTEQGCAEENTTQRARHEFGFSLEQMIECKRRTFWSGFLMDRYCGPTSSSINPEDVFLRLPCFEETYERGYQSDAPHYNNGTIDPLKASLTATSAVSPMGWLILVAAIWGDVANFIYRAVHRSPVAYAEEYEKFYENTRAALQNWSARLPHQLQFSPANVERSIQGGYAGPFISMHVLYHLAWVKMSRFVRHSLIPLSLARNVRASHKHSHDLLQVMSTLRTAKWEMMDRDGHAASFSFTTPFAGYAILAAIDVVGAGGLDSNLRSSLDLISCGLESLRELARYWNSARDQDKVCEKRYYQIQNVLKHPFTARSGCWLGREWGVHSSLEREFAEADDCIYGADDRSFFDALREDPHNRSLGGEVRAAA